jgi:hypothetical protein
VDTSQSGTYSEAHDSEWEGRVERAANADVRELLRSARRRRRERWLVAATVLVAVALTLILMVRIGLFDGLLGAETPAAPRASTGEPTQPAALALDVSHPFAKSPAANWPDGAAGIVPPEARPVGGFSAGQVANATRQVREMLMASRLDPRILINHDATAFLGALAPDARRQLEPLFGTGREAEVQSLVSLLAEGSRLLPVDPKVTGKMAVHVGGPGELVVHTNYVFVYAFGTDAPGKIVDPLDILVVVRAEVDYVLRTGDRWTPGSQGWWYGETRGYAYSIACDAYHRGFLAPAFTERTANEASPTDRGLYFDPDRTLPAASGCPK